MKSLELDLVSTEWVKSSYSGPQGGECVECSPSFIAHGVVPVRDSKVSGGPVLSFPLPEWAGFVSALKRGDI